MESSHDGSSAPDSWETADLEDSVARLMLSSRGFSPPSSSNFSGEDGVLLPKSGALSSCAPSGGAAVAASGSSEMVVGASEEAVAQVDQFLREALQNPRERLSVLRIEQDLLRFIRDSTQQQFEIPPLPTSYLRLAAHRVAQHYHLQSMVLPDPNLPDGSGSRILIRKTSDRCLPLIRLADIPLNVPQEEKSNTLKVAIKQRPQNKASAKDGSTTKSSTGNAAKSVEERKEEYNRARARIFNVGNGPSSASGGKFEGESSVALDNHLQRSSSILPPSLLDNSSLAGSDFYAVRRTFSDTSLGSNSSRTGRSRTDKEQVVTRNKSNNRVAIFRDQEVDRKDPDYNRNYDRYAQRFDPGFGFSSGPYTMQPLYTPALNYNTEFPQLGSVGHRSPQVQSIEHQIPPLAQHHACGQWTGAPPSPSTMGYASPENIMLPPSFSHGNGGAHNSPSMYHLHSSQYACPPRLNYVHPHEHIPHNFGQSPQQQPEGSFGLARPR